MITAASSNTDISTKRSVIARYRIFKATKICKNTVNLNLGDFCSPVLGWRFLLTRCSISNVAQYRPHAHWAPSIKNAEDSSSESHSAESSEITRNNRTALNLSPSKPARSLQKKYGDAFENDFRTRLDVMMKIHSRSIARPLNRFTHVESIQPGFQVLSNGHESIQRTRFNGCKFNRRRPLATTFSSCIIFHKIHYAFQMNFEAYG